MNELPEEIEKACAMVWMFTDSPSRIEQTKALARAILAHVERRISEAVGAHWAEHHNYILSIPKLGTPLMPLAAPPSPPALEPCIAPPQMTMDHVPSNPIAAFEYGFRCGVYTIRDVMRGP